jgi:tryptophanyl-tRNA synthetase
MSKQVILTGLRTNDEYHIGNYLGAMRPIIELAKKHSEDYMVNMFVPDLHSFTTPIDHTTFYKRSLKNLRVFFAAGLPMNMASVHVYRQSYVPAHSELAVVLNNFAPFGQLSRMVEFKEKRERFDEEFVSVGLFDYPVLMASDILLYDAKYVPVGDDQRQHLELARDLAERFNNKFGEIFVLPATIREQATFFGVDEPLRIMSLQDPTHKMSKSVSDPNGTIMIFDDPAHARKKVMSAVTDSVGFINFDRSKQPGIANLLTMLSVLSNTRLSDVIKQFEGHTTYGDLKKAVADEVEKLLVTLQTNFAKIDEVKVLKKLEIGESYANKVANTKLLQVQKAVGLRA